MPALVRLALHQSSEAQPEVKNRNKITHLYMIEYYTRTGLERYYCRVRFRIDRGKGMISAREGALAKGGETGTLELC